MALLFFGVRSTVLMHQSKTFEHCRTMLHELERCKEMIVVTLSEVGRKQFIDNRTEQRWRREGGKEEYMRVCVYVETDRMEQV